MPPSFQTAKQLFRVVSVFPADSRICGIPPDESDLPKLEGYELFTILPPMRTADGSPMLCFVFQRSNSQPVGRAVSESQLGKL